VAALLIILPKTWRQKSAVFVLAIALTAIMSFLGVRSCFLWQIGSLCENFRRWQDKKESAEHLRAFFCYHRPPQ
jgi:hypothetical protein